MLSTLFAMMSSIHAYRAEPAVADPPQRVSRDWWLVALATVSALLEGLLRTDLVWRWVELAVCLAIVPLLLIRRTHPLLTVAVGFTAMMALNLAAVAVTGKPAGLTTGAVMLIPVYALYRWGSGRHGVIGGAVIVAVAVIGNLTDAGSVGDVIGGVIVLSLPVEFGLMVRYRASARARQLDQIKMNERELLARELHDIVAHHVSAIAIQAQAGQAIAATQPDAAIRMLDVIAEEASRTLSEMRSMVGALRSGEDAELAPQQGITDLRRLTSAVGHGQARGPVIEVHVADGVLPVSPAIDAAVYRIAQESITNAVRHARHATLVRVTVDASNDLVRLTVTDDGDPTSFDAATAGYGLLGMAERVKLLDGRFHAGPGGGRGWTVMAELPRSGSPR